MATAQSIPHRTRPGRPKGWRKGGVKVSKMVLRRIEHTRALTASIEVFKAQVAAGLATRFSPALAEGESLPDYRLSLDLVGRSVRSTELLDELVHLELLEQSGLEEKHEAMRAFDATHGEALRLVQSTFAFAGYGESFARMLRSTFQRRLLIRRARDKREIREKRQAHAEGRVKQTLRAAATSALGWIGRRPRSVA